MILCLFAFASPTLFSQRAGFVDMETIRKKFQEAEIAEQRIRTIVEVWKLEIKAMQEQINKLEYEIENNRLIWSEEVRKKNEMDLEQLVKKKSDYSTEKFQPGGEFDKIAKHIQAPVEAKINDYIQENSIEEELQIFEEKGK